LTSSGIGYSDRSDIDGAEFGPGHKEAHADAGGIWLGRKEMKAGKIC
jgi:hypothetical protein